MYILIAYDVNTTTASGEKRLRKIAKECVNYGQRVQNSVFECLLTEAQFITLKSKLIQIMDFEFDSIRCYFLGKNIKIEVVGRETSYNASSELII